MGSPIAASRVRSSSRLTNSSCTSSWTTARPSDVQRWPAVPKPENSAPSTARSRSASSITTSGFLPPSSRHGFCRWRPQSSPILAPTALEPVKPTLSTRPASSARSRPAKVAAPSACTRLSTPPGTPPAWKRRASASPERGRVLRRLPHDGVAAQDRRDEVPRGHRDGEVAGGDDRGDADRDAEGEELLVGHLRRHGLAVEPPALADEEVAGVDDLLHLAERLGVGLADLLGDEPGERLLVLLDEPADVGDHAAADRRGDRRPLGLRLARGAAGVLEGLGVAEQHVGDDLVGAGGVGGRQAASGRVFARPAVDDGGDGARHGR